MRIREGPHRRAVIAGLGAALLSAALLIPATATAEHTPGHVSLLLESGSERLLVGGDALTRVAISFARPDWRLGTDYDRDRAIATRRRLLDQLVPDRLPLIGFHLPFPGHGMVERAGAAYRFVPRTI